MSTQAHGEKKTRDSFMKMLSNVYLALAWMLAWMFNQYIDTIQSYFNSSQLVDNRIKFTAYR